MIHYHGTPISGTQHEAVRFLTSRHALVSYADPSYMALVAECCASFIIDNGAYTTWKRGLEFEDEEYAAFVEEWCQHPGFDFALIPDQIDGDETINDLLIDRWELGGYGVPIWHLHESLERLARLAKDWPRVALGSSGKWPTPGTESWWERMAEAMDAVCDRTGRPRCKLHGLRMLDPSVFTQLPLASADSANAGINAGSIRRFGQYLPVSSGLRAEVIASRIENQNSAPLWTRRERLCDTSLFISPQ